MIARWPIMLGHLSLGSLHLPCSRRFAFTSSGSIPVLDRTNVLHDSAHPQARALQSGAKQEHLLASGLCRTLASACISVRTGNRQRAQSRVAFPACLYCAVCRSFSGYLPGPFKSPLNGQNRSTSRAYLSPHADPSGSLCWPSSRMVLLL